MSGFVHLHVHTQYSILDGASNVKKLINRAKELEMPAIAITDHGNLFGVKEFHKTAKAAGIKPILGCEAYVARRTRFDKDKDVKEDKSGNHMVILAKNHIGYKNLVKLISYSWIDGFYSKPRIDKEILYKYKEGLIISSACIAGEIPRYVRSGEMDKAEAVILELKAEFGEDFYLEVMRHPTNDPMADQTVYPQQVIANNGIFELAEKTGVKVIATNDVHFIRAEEAEAHDRLICINTNSLVTDTKRMRYTKQEYLKSFEEMQKLFSDHPEVLENTLEIEAKVEEYSIDHEAVTPQFTIPEGFQDDDDYLKHLSFEGAKLRYGEITDEVKDRLDFELNTVKKMGYPGYFLIVWDFIRAAREMGIWVGPGRGSAAGSVISYCLRITDLDPLKYGLLFERFLNPDRISMPDIDIDFDEDGREKILEWVVEKYGYDRVANVVTFGTMAAKSAIKDVARVENMSIGDATRMTKMIPDGVTELGKAYNASPELKALRDTGDDASKKILTYAEMLEGSVRQTGIHACGVIIGRDALINYIPICISKESKLLVSQFEGQYLEEVGMLKMDFLGLRTLSINKDTVAMIEKLHKKKIVLEELPLDDSLTYDLYAKGLTSAVFQFESPGMKKYLKELQPNRFEDLIAMNALYRPGPIKYIPSFINRKNGKEEIKYNLPAMQEILEETYGVTVYQEQVMLLSQKLANFSKGDADKLRKAMGKKQRSVLDKMKPAFLEGSKANGYDAKICEEIWNDWEAFAEYAFNKSHSTCYAYLSYHTAYLKAHYPAEFMAANLSRNLSDIKEITKLMETCRRMKISVLGPSVNESELKFSVVKDQTIRFGLSAIKNVGEMAARSIIEEREKNGKYTDIFNFFERVNYTIVNKRTFEALALSGGFDEFKELKRYQFFSERGNEPVFIDTLMKFGGRVQGDKEKNQLSLFGEAISTEIIKPQIPEREPWSQIFELNKERDLIGLYVSSHPLDPYLFEIHHMCNMVLSDLNDLKELKGRDLIFGGFVTKTETMTDKRGNPYERFVIEDYTDSHSFALFGKNYINFGKYIKPGLSLFIHGEVQNRSFGREVTDELEFRFKTIHVFSDVKAELIKKITMTINVDFIDDLFLTVLEEVCVASKGKVQLAFRIVEPSTGTNISMFSRNYLISITPEFVEFIEENDFLGIKVN
ncbi:MAG: DNA polymerase III subunit alpha [Bacteroidetes bacterium HGW-Bacteroidetes-21]|nr:MAG: DNA polymerase III subunit alpha [Bacteroidetes bacterium HGW-Bacteroidetes-21]